MKRILILIKGLGRGGAEQILASSARYLDHTAYRYEIAYLSPWKNALVEELEAQGIPCFCLRNHGGRGWLRSLGDLISDHRIDLVHVHSPYPAIGARLALRNRVHPLVYTEHGLWNHHHPATKWGNLFTFSRNQHVFAVSHYVRDSIHYPAPLGFLPMPPVEILYHGVDLDVVDGWQAREEVRRELEISEDVHLVATVANFRPLKGYEDLLRAVPLVIERDESAHFILVGTGPYQQEIQRLCSKLGLEDRVTFLGFRSDAPRVVSACDAFVLASHYEGLSIALIEAMALAKASVVTRVGGIPEIIGHGKEGLLVPPHSPSLLAGAITQLLENEDLRNRLGNAARRRAQNFHIKHAVHRIESVYAQLLN